MAQPTLEDLISQLGPEPVDPFSGPAPATYQGSNLLESMAGLENQNLPAPRGFGESLLQGFAGGIGRAGTRASMARQKFEQSNASRQALRDQDNLARSREYRQRKFELTKDFANRKPEKVETPKTVALAPWMQESNPSLKRIPLGTQIDQDWAKPTEAKAAEKTKLVEVTNPDGSKSLVPERAGLVTTPKGGADKTKPATEFQAKAGFFYGRALEAEKLATAGGLEQRILKKAWGTKAPNVLKDPDQRAYTTAKQSFTLALNRLESGANVTPTEFERVEQIYFVQPGDDEAAIKTKAALRRSTIDGLEKLQSTGDRAAGRTEPTMPAIPSTWKKVTSP